MAWLKDRSERRHNEAEAAAAAERQQRLAAEAAHATQLREMIEMAKVFRGLSANDLDERPPIVLKKGESVFAVLEGCTPHRTALDRCDMAGWVTRTLGQGAGHTLDALPHRFNAGACSCRTAGADAR
jgi:hypothetical protein